MVRRLTVTEKAAPTKCGDAAARVVPGLVVLATLAASPAWSQGAYDPPMSSGNWPILREAADPATEGHGGPEVIGPFTVFSTPVSASLVSGVFFGWLNVVKRPVTVDEAFTGFSVIDDGYANAVADTVLEVVYEPGAAVNGPGDDVVLLDARFSSNSYAVSTSFDAFSVELALPFDAFLDTGVDQEYYYEGCLICGPFRADVWGVGIDLSDLGVPMGSAVNAIRLRTTSGEADPLAIGVLQPPAECFLVLAEGEGTESFGAIGHTWTTQLSGITTWYAVTLSDGPSFEIPIRRRARQLDPTAIGEFTAQVLMWNPNEFPGNPEQYSRGVKVTLWSDGGATSQAFGARDGVDLRMEVHRGSSGESLLSFPFTIDGFGQ